MIIGYRVISTEKGAEDFLAGTVLHEIHKEKILFDRFASDSILKNELMKELIYQERNNISTSPSLKLVDKNLNWYFFQIKSISGKNKYGFEISYLPTRGKYTLISFGYKSN
ncbi:MAG: hypothetical protein OEZ58_19355 [Gammaproteobacteria bacterium]|nr:hypothetical protein [Gammaproteobacteria bacterium]MDH5731147.1 hypothetical protein [Gammaproteobacteria bacterium]